MPTRRKGSTRKGMRKGRKMTRGAMRQRMRGKKMWWHMGGAQVVLPADLTDSSMGGPARMSLSQGGDYLSLHKGQYGGAAVNLSAAAPMGYTGMLDDSLRATARVTPIDESVSAIQGMQDGGSRRGKRANHKAMLAMLKKINKKLSRRKQRGGMPYALTQAQDYSSPGMLLSPSAERAALGGMNPEWKLASDPGAFAPNM